MMKQIRIAISLLITFTLLTGFIYPVVVTGIAQLFWTWKANGSIIQRQGKLIGSLLIGQAFTSPAYFWGRPSATTPFPYNAANSSGSNLGPSNPDLLAAVKARAALLQSADHQLIPVDLVTTSASGLDPEISPLAAFYQIPRIAKLRNISEADLQILVKHLIKKRTFYLLGEPRVNVLELNLALDRFSANKEF